MKTLYLLRHAKSSRDNPSISDFDRPLSARGKKDALMMGWVMKQQDICPDVIVCSSSKRTRSTLKRICRMTDVKKEDIIYEDTLYESSLQSLLYRIASLDNSFEHALLLGHNPSFTELALLFDLAVVTVKTCGLLTITFDCQDRN
jgi:phosphohistidine phosphatase